MDVLHVIPSISDYHGGPSYAIFQYANYQKKLGLTPVIVTTDFLLGDYKKKSKTVPIFIFPKLNSNISIINDYAISFKLIFWLLFNIKKFDLIHIHSLFSFPSTFTMLISRIYKKKYILRTIGQLMDWSLKQSYLHKKIYLLLIENSNIEAASLVHMTSDIEVNQFKNKFQNKNIINLPIGVHLPSIEIKEKKEKSNLNYLFLSRIHPKKQLELLFFSLEILLKKDFTNWTLDIVGDGNLEYINYLKRLSVELGIEEKLRWRGFLIGSDKYKVIQSSDWFILPSASENFGIAVAECLAFGLPVILSPNLGVSSLVSSYNAGYIFNGDHNALSECLLKKANKQPDLKIRKSSRLVAEEFFGWESITSKLELNYKKLVFGNH